MNVLFIITDQQRADHLGCAGNPILKTPNLDKLASEGVRFTNAYCSNPMCSPNRASLLTGLYPNAHGLKFNRINLPLNVPTITQTLRNSGYHTISVGKMHLQSAAPTLNKESSVEFGPQWRDNTTKMIDTFPSPYYGFDEVEITIGHGDICTGHYTQWLEERSPKSLEYIKNMNPMRIFTDLVYKTELPEEFYPSTYVTERTIAFLERYANGDYGDKSFFMHCSYPDPHHPICPPGKYQTMYDPDDIELPASYHDFENIKNHKFLKRFIENPIAPALLNPSTEEEIRKFTAGTYGAISLIDHGVGQILASLEKLGLADNTMIVYTSDHGDLMGDHRLTCKGPSPFNGVLQVPLLWKVPGLTKRGGKADSIVTSIDIPKTILSLLNIKQKAQPPDMQGVDLTPALKDPEKKVRDCCLIEEDEILFRSPIRVRHLVTDNYKLTLYSELEDHGDLFDRKNDPHELRNLWYDENYKDLRFELVNKLYHENLKAQILYPRRKADIEAYTRKQLRDLKQSTEK